MRRAAELEELGLRHDLASRAATDDVFVRRCARSSSATSRIVVATGIVNVVDEAARGGGRGAAASSGAAHPGRFLLGLGVSHAPMVAEYRTPLHVMRAYLDALDQLAGRARATSGSSPHSRPRMLALARDRSGWNPHLPRSRDEHTAGGPRGAWAAGPLLAPELGVVLETDPARARAIARRHLETYQRLPNYVKNWRASGFTPRRRRRRRQRPARRRA